MSYLASNCELESDLTDNTLEQLHPNEAPDIQPSTSREHEHEKT
jgi:hypothetical protein